MSTFALVAALSGCSFEDVAWPPGLPAPAPVPLPEPEPEPQPAPTCKGVDHWVSVVVPPECAACEQAGPTATIATCDRPMWIYADGCYGEHVLLERRADDGTWEAMGPLWDCAWGGPATPIYLEPGGAHVVDATPWAPPTGAWYRWTFWVTHDFSCPEMTPPPGNPWPCAGEQPWEELVSAPFQF